MARVRRSAPLPLPPSSAPSPATPAAHEARETRVARRRHKPHELGPRLEQRGRWWTADLRPWGGQRYTSLRNPKAPGWPQRGDRTEEADIADRWKWAYVDLLGDATRRRQLGRPAKRATLGAEVARYLEWRSTQQFAWSTITHDGTVLETHLVPALGAERPIDAIDTAAVQRLFDGLARDGYAPATIKLYRALALGFFAWLGRRDEHNPVVGVVVPELIRPDIATFADVELEQLRAAADDVDAGRVRTRFEGRCPFPMRLAIELGLTTGGRQAELFALEWPAIREATRTVRLTVQLDRASRDPIAAVAPLKSKEARTALVLPGWWDHHQRRARGRVLAAPGYNAARLLDVANKWINRLYDHAKLNADGQAWHVLRHTYSRHFIEAGGRLEELQKSLGHGSIKTTELYYGHLSEDSAAELARQRIYGDHPVGRGPQLVGQRRETGS